MKKFSQYIVEDLNDELTPNIEQSEAAQQAATMGLQYVGFGRYEDPATGQIAYIVQNNKLMPYSKAVKTNTYAAQNGDDFGALAQSKTPQMQQDINVLTGAYSPEDYEDDELDAIKNFTGGAYEQVNNKLSQLPAGIPSPKIQPDGPDDLSPQMIASLDNVMSKSTAPINFYTYVTLGDDVPDIDTGTDLKFKGFRSTTLDIGTALSEVQTNQAVLLQLLIEQGDQGLFADDFSATPGQSEFILPRGARVQVLDGPHKLRGSSANGDMTVYFYNCQLA